MRDAQRLILYWSPRAIAILFAVFLSLFALDVFGQGLSLWETIGALLMHLVPTALILIVLAIAWRRDLVGAFIFIALGFLYMFIAWGQFNWSAYAVISGPLFLIGILFLFNWLQQRELGVSL